jgi:hypothetical protein
VRGGLGAGERLAHACAATANVRGVCALLEHGQESGEVRADVDVDLALDLFFGPVWYRRLVGHAPLTQDFAHALADALVDSVAPRPAGA